MLEHDTSFSVIISDLAMPGMSGAEFLARAHELAPHTVQIILTGGKRGPEVPRESHVFRLLEKPCSHAELANAVADALATAASSLKIAEGKITA